MSPIPNTTEAATPETTPAADQAPKTPRKSPTPKAASAGKKNAQTAKATIAKAKTTKVKGPAKPKADRTPAGERRAEVVKVLRKAGAKSAADAKGLDFVAEKMGNGTLPIDVYRLVSGGSGKAGSSPTCLIATGHCKTAEVEGVKGLAVYLTKKGQDADLKSPPFAKA